MIRGVGVGELQQDAAVGLDLPGEGVEGVLALLVDGLFAGAEDVQITLELEPDKEYDVQVGGSDLGRMRTNLGGKLVFSVEARMDEVTPVKVTGV